MMKSLKTPLRYPGGKSKACKKMDPYFPDLGKYTEFREPFLGGGSVSIHITKKYPHLQIWVNDLYEPLYNFWKQLQHDPQQLQDDLLRLKEEYPDPTEDELRKEAKEIADAKANEQIDAQGNKQKYNRTLIYPAHELYTKSVEIANGSDASDLDRASAFYIANKCSFSGLTSSSSFSYQASYKNFNVSGISKLVGYGELIKDWKITNLRYQELLTDDKKCFTYLDPPYEIKDKLYGKNGSMHKGFDHDGFSTICDRFVGPQLISYNSSQLIKDRFKDYQTGEFDLTYTMRSVGEYMRDQKDRKELLLFNYKIEGLGDYDFI